MPASRDSTGQGRVDVPGTMFTGFFGMYEYGTVQGTVLYCTSVPGEHIQHKV